MPEEQAAYDQERLECAEHKLTNAARHRGAWHGQNGQQRDPTQ
jgi:hypothetical protein